MKLKTHLVTITAIAIAALALPLHAADTKPTKSTGKADGSPAKDSAATDAKTAKLPFKGRIASVDKGAKTITLEAKIGEGRVIHIGTEAKIMKGDSTDEASWDDLKTGEEIRGSYLKSDDGKMEAVKVKIGAKAAAADKPAKADKTEKPAKKAKKTE